MTIKLTRLHVAVRKGTFSMLAVLPAFFLLTPPTLAAVIVDNRTQDVDSSTTPVDYLVRNNGTLNVVSGTTRSIFVESGSTLNINGATINANSDTEGLSITGSSRATINQATVTSDTLALSVNRAPGAAQGSSVSASNSEFNGGNAGAEVTGLSTLELVNSGLTGTASGSVGLNLRGGTVQASAGSRINGDAAGVLMDRDPSNVGDSSLKLDNSSVVGRSGPAIKVQGGIDASIEVLNNSTLQGGNGNVLEVLGGSTAGVSVANSSLQGNVQVSESSSADLSFNQGHMTGDVVVEEGSTANVTLQNNSQLIGRLDKVSSVTLDASTWTMTGNDSIGSLTMTGGTVDFGIAPGAFRELNVETLNGNGTFAMSGDFATGGADRLNVTGEANGEFDLAVSATGKDAVSPQQLTLVHTAAGTAQFSLVGGRVDVGTWSYDLASSTDGAGGTEWFLDPATKTVSPGAQSVLALFQTAITISYGELKSLETRMGELQTDGNLHGVWVRPYGNKYNVDEDSGVGYRQRQQGLSLGADTRLGESEWRVGVLAGYSESDLNLDGGTSGNVDSYYIGPYFSWLNPDNGYYVDGALKFNHYRNDSKVILSDGTRAKGDYSNSGVSALVEVGRNITLADDWFVKPSAQLSAAVIRGADYDLDNGMQAEGDRTRSLRGKLGVASGRSFNIDRNTVVQPYGRVAMVHEFASNDNAHVNGNALNTSLKGSGFEVGAGVAVSLSKNLRFDVGVDYGKSEKFEQPWAGTLGVSYGF
ncbi:autotransporter outer membrane beta-barrel domain-containing protein [Pseudomonas sp. PDM32]|uniref:autotransporter outer membrane beta-barrel domain-containing protein n=1 Tax=Pseudomonas sp. PDM32 TaxID=2854768 RepID=UPI001C47D8AF|nr:autotransporter outer membrane beta-barrel domain-containing protein [Pseudomonas sp. PDM32]MBV7572328.1 autotransporter outer membrane beta-barrel domain-containing protein [Pseudomonas sp. PDM32]